MDIQAVDRTRPLGELLGCSQIRGCLWWWGEPLKRILWCRAWVIEEILKNHIFFSSSLLFSYFCTSPYLPSSIGLVFVYYCILIPFIPFHLLDCTDDLVLTYSRATFSGGLNESCPIRLHQSLLALALIPLKLVAGTLFQVLVTFFTNHCRPHLPVCHLLYKISASLVVFNISCSSTILWQSQIPYVTLCGSCTTPSCLFVLQWELLCCAVFWWNFSSTYLYRKLCAASPVATNSITSLLTV